jgi:hypothetical protein
VDDASVRVALTPPEAGQILDVEVKRTYLARPAEDEFRKAEADVRAISDQVAALDDETKVLDAQAKQIEALRAFSLDKFPKDAAAREIKTAEYGQVVDFVAESLRKIAKARRELEVKKRDLDPELAARQRKQNELHQRAQLEQRTVYVDVNVGAGARTEGGRGEQDGGAELVRGGFADDGRGLDGRGADSLHTEHQRDAAHPRTGSHVGGQRAVGGARGPGDRKRFL